MRQEAGLRPLREQTDLVAAYLADRIPAGRVMTFAAIAGHLGRGGPRGVGGTLPSHLMVDAQPHWVIERTATRDTRGDRCRRRAPQSGRCGISIPLP